MNYGVASSSSWSNSIYNPELCITEIRGPFQHYCLPFKREHLEQVRPSRHEPVSPKGELFTWTTPMIGWVVVLRCTRKSRVRKVTHHSTISALGELWCCFIPIWPDSICYPKTGMTRIRWPANTTTSLSKANTLNEARTSWPAPISSRGSP